MGHYGYKKISYAIIILFLVVFVCAGCGANNSQKDTGADATGDEKWPTKPITIIVGQKAGGSNDLFARGLAQYLPKVLGVPVAVENIEGGSGMVGLNEFLRRPDDGYTLFVLNQPKVSLGHLVEGENYSLEDFAFITSPQLDYPTVTVNVDSPYKTFDELIEDIKAKPGKLAMGVMINTGAHISGLVLCEQLGIEPRVVTYGGGNDFRVAMSGGHLDFGMGNAAGDYSFRDKMRPLAVFTDEPFELYPDVPPINKALEPYGVKVPIGIGSLRNIMVLNSFKEKYPERYEILVDAFKKVYEDKEYQEHIQKTGEASITKWRSPEESLELNQLYEDVIKRYKDVLAETK